MEVDASVQIYNKEKYFKKKLLYLSKFNSYSPLI